MHTRLPARTLNRIERRLAPFNTAILLPMSEHADIKNPKHPIPFTFYEGGCKSLHFSIDQLQSRMRVGQPDQLDVDYTKTMMGFRVLNPRPRHIVMIGLGGGSLAKFCYRNLPEARITVVEINPHVIALRKEFLVPDDDERFKVIEADGADFVRDAECDVDVLLVDGFDHRGQSPQLGSQDFYNGCRRVLTDHGVTVVNLHENHPLYEHFIDRIGRSFDKNFVEVVANREGNVITFAGKGCAISAVDLHESIELARATFGDSNPLQTVSFSEA